MQIAASGASIALITGGASGIGRALAGELAGRSWEVVLADRQHELAREAAAQLASRGGRVSAWQLDVRDLKQWGDLHQSLNDRGAEVDLLINNAGIGVGGEMAQYSAADWDDVLDVNLRGVAYGIQAFYPGMVQRGRGQIVNVASMAGLLPVAYEGSYTTSKHAVVGLSKALRAEAAVHGVRVSVVCPGVVRTPILSGGTFGRLPQNLSEKVLSRYWESMRPMDVHEFARRVVPRILASEAIIIEPTWWKLFWYLERLSPDLGLYLAERNFRRLMSLINRSAGE